MIHSEDSLTSPHPAGRVRISAAAIDKVVLASVQSSPGVTDVHGLVLGSVIGTVSGAIVGFVEAGPAGAAVGATLGAAAGAAAGDYLEHRRARTELYDAHADSPRVTVRISAEYTANLESVADCVRQNVLDRVRDTLGMSLEGVDVEIVDVGDTR